MSALRFSYEKISQLGPDVTHFRIRDERDNRVATCYTESNAVLVTMALNFSAGVPVDWVCGHNATAMCATCYQDLAIKAHELAEENIELREGAHAG